MIKLLCWFGLLTREQAERLEESHVPLRTSTLANAGLAILVIGFAGLMASCTARNTLITPISNRASPPYRTCPRLARRRSHWFPDQEALHAFRTKVDRLQRELDRLVTPTSRDYERKLADKTSESQDLGRLAERLRE